MKIHHSSFIILFIFISSYNTYAQDNLVTSRIVIDSINSRILELEKSNQDLKDAQKLAETQTQQNKNRDFGEQFKNAKQVIQTGLERGSEIEQIFPFTLQLIALKDLTETLNSINNPTSTSLGTPFSLMVIESASTHLLPQFPNETLKQQAKTKFKNLLEAIYKGPLVQGLINSNPISSTINAAIQQAGFFEKPRDPNIELSKQQIRNVSNNSPLKVPINTANFEGAPFTNVEMNAFNAELEKRIEFYTTINQYGNSQNHVTQQFYMDAKLLKKSIKASKTEICKLLGIDPNNTSAEFNAKFDNISVDQMKIYLRDANFKKAISLSDYATEQLPEVKEFNKLVVYSLTKFIDDYIKILNDYKNIAEAKFIPSEIEKQVRKLEGIKSVLKSPMESLPT